MKDQEGFIVVEMGTNLPERIVIDKATPLQERLQLYRGFTDRAAILTINKFAARSISETINTDCFEKNGLDSDSNSVLMKVELLSIYALVKKELGEYTEALSALNKAILLTSAMDAAPQSVILSDPCILELLMGLICEWSSKFDEAVNHYNEALRLSSMYHGKESFEYVMALAKVARLRSNVCNDNRTRHWIFASGGSASTRRR